MPYNLKDPKTGQLIARNPQNKEEKARLDEKHVYNAMLRKAKKGDTKAADFVMEFKDRVLYGFERELIAKMSFKISKIAEELRRELQDASKSLVE